MSQMAAEARNSGFKYLIKEMNKMQVDNDEKGKVDKKATKDVDKASSTNVQEKPKPAKAAKSGDDNSIKELVQGFFKQSNQPKKDKNPVDLFVGRPRKRSTPKQSVAVKAEAPKPRASRAKKKPLRRRA